MTMMSLLLLLLLLLSSSMQLVSMLDRAVAGKQPVSFRTAMSGVHFKVAAMHAPPLMTISKNAGGNTTYHGYIKDICDWIFDAKHNTTYEFIEGNMQQTVQLGLIDFGFQMVVKGVADMGALPMSPDPERAKIADFTGPVHVSQYHFACPYPKSESKLYGMIRPFQNEVWMLALVAVICVPLVLAVLITVYKRQEAGVTFRGSLSTTVEYTVRTIFMQAGGLLQKFLSLRVLSGVWSLMALVLVLSYKGTLTSHLAIPKLEKVPSTFSELAARPDLQVVVEYKSKIQEMMMTAESGPLKVLGDTLRSDERYVFRSRKEGNILAGTGYVCYPGVDILGNNLVAYMKRFHGRCTMTMAPRTTGLTRTYHFPMTKDGPYSKFISKKLQYTWETGLNDHWYKSYMPTGENCRTDQLRRMRNVSLKLADLSSAFFVWGIGIGATVVVFIVEHAVAAAAGRRLAPPSP